MAGVGATKELDMVVLEPLLRSTEKGEGEDGAGGGGWVFESHGEVGAVDGADQASRAVAVPPLFRVFGPD